MDVDHLAQTFAGHSDKDFTTALKKLHVSQETISLSTRPDTDAFNCLDQIFLSLVLHVPLEVANVGAQGTTYLTT